MSSQEQPLLSIQLQSVHRIVKEQLSYDLKDQDLTGQQQLEILQDAEEKLSKQVHEMSSTLTNQFVYFIYFCVIWALSMVPFYEDFGETASLVIAILMVAVFLIFAGWSVKGQIEIRRKSNDLKIIQERMELLQKRQ